MVFMLGISTGLNRVVISPVLGVSLDVPVRRIPGQGCRFALLGRRGLHRRRLLPGHPPWLGRTRLRLPAGARASDCDQERQNDGETHAG